MSKYSEAILRLLPEASFNLTHYADGTYDILWYDDRPQPDNDDIDAEVLLVEVEIPWRAIRDTRRILLRSCDWTAVGDSPLNEEDQAAWEAYRQELRDIPQDFDDAEDVEWPEQPSG